MTNWATKITASKNLLIKVIRYYIFLKIQLQACEKLILLKGYITYLIYKIFKYLTPYI